MEVLSKKMSEQTKARQIWTEGEDIQVIALSANNIPPCSIATILGKKNKTAVYARRCVLRREAGTKDPEKVINHIRQKGNINEGRTNNQQLITDNRSCPAPIQNGLWAAFTTGISSPAPSPQGYRAHCMSHCM